MGGVVDDVCSNTDDVSIHNNQCADITNPPIIFVLSCNAISYYIAIYSAQFYRLNELFL